MGSEKLRFDGKVVIVTGGARGLGAAYAHAFADRGAKVVVNDFSIASDGTAPDSAPVEGAVQRIRQDGGDAIAVFALAQYPNKLFIIKLPTSNMHLGENDV